MRFSDANFTLVAGWVFFATFEQKNVNSGDNLREIHMMISEGNVSQIRVFKCPRFQ
jgi:hypothetical protein